MTKLFIVLLLASAGHGFGKCITDETELISTLLVHRHGDRTPLLFQSNLTTDPKAVEAAMAPYGHGQLTDVGKRRCYMLGKTIRARYNKLLSPRYNRSEIYIRTTESERTKMSVLVAMAAVYPAYPGSWSDEINWLPTSYTFVPVKFDFNVFTLNCPNFITPYNELLNSNSSRLEKYINILKIVDATYGLNFTTTPVLALLTLYDVYVSQLSLGIPLSPEIAAIFPELKKAAEEAIDILLGNEDNIVYEGGVMLNEFLTQVDNLIAGRDTPRVRIYSAHDHTVYGFEAAALVTPRQGVPGYAAYFALELRKRKQTGEYVVLPVYQSEPADDPIYLPVAGCNSLLCPYETFKKLVSKYVLDEDSWRIKCGFTNDFLVDLVT